jgi:hypothetical protein
MGMNCSQLSRLKNDRLPSATRRLCRFQRAGARRDLTDGLYRSSAVLTVLATRGWHRRPTSFRVEMSPSCSAFRVAGRPRSSLMRDCG